MTKGFSFLTFKVLEHRPKTEIWGVYSKLHGHLLGRLRWYGAWRQYVLVPGEGTIWSRGCLDDVSAFLANLAALRAACKLASSHKEG